MPRRPRVELEGGVYHVYNRVASGEAVFADPDEAIGFVDLIRKVKARDGWTVFAWCVMSNHYHLAVRTSAIPLSRGLHHLQCTFSRGFNRRRGRTGSLWQSRYQAKLVDEQTYLSQLVLYVHLNPVRAGVAEDPADYVLSGHREIVKRVSGPLTDVDQVLLSFGETLRTARRAYLGAMRSGCEAAGASGRPVAASFRSLVWHDRELERKPGQPFVDILGRSTGLERPRMTAEQFIEAVCELLEVKPERLASRVRDSATAELRRIVAALGMERWSQRGTELAAALGKNAEVVSWWAGQGVRRRLEDADFARRIDDLDAALAQRA